MKNGYVNVYMPSHERAHSNGCVYAHILQAEATLGRKLKDGECVHHIDKNRKNNDASNLMVFDCSRSHTAYHAGHSAVRLPDGTYTVPLKELEKSKESNWACPECGCRVSTRGRRCIHCAMLARRKADRPSENELRELTTKYSFASIGKMYGVSGSAIVKWCKCYGLPYKKKEIKANSR